MVFNLIKKYVRSRIARARAKRFGGGSAGFLAAYNEVLEDSQDDLYREDLAACWRKDPSVIKRDIKFERVWEMYYSNSKKVYVYFPPTGERRIYEM